MKHRLNTLGFASSAFHSSAFSLVKRIFKEFWLGFPGLHHSAIDIVLFCGSRTVASTTIQKPTAELLIEPLSVA